MKTRQGKKTTLISTSAVGYYGFHDDEELEESNAPGNDFLASLSKDWEAAAMHARNYGVRVLICRLGIVLGTRGGALGQMIPLFKMGLGSPSVPESSGSPGYTNRTLFESTSFYWARKICKARSTAQPRVR